MAQSTERGGFFSLFFFFPFFVFSLFCFFSPLLAVQRERGRGGRWKGRGCFKEGKKRKEHNIYVALRAVVDPQCVEVGALGKL
jgi:hypothetical protein